MGAAKWGEGKLNTQFRNRIEVEASGLLAKPVCICRVDQDGSRWLNAGCHVHGGLSSVRAYP